MAVLVLRMDHGVVFRSGGPAEVTRGGRTAIEVRTIGKEESRAVRTAEPTTNFTVPRMAVVILIRPVRRQVDRHLPRGCPG